VEVDSILHDVGPMQHDEKPVAHGIGHDAIEGHGRIFSRARAELVSRFKEKRTAGFQSTMEALVPGSSILDVLKKGWLGQHGGNFETAGDSGSAVWLGLGPSPSRF